MIFSTSSWKKIAIPNDTQLNIKKHGYKRFFFSCPQGFEEKLMCSNFSIIFNNLPPQILTPTYSVGMKTWNINLSMNLLFRNKRKTFYFIILFIYLFIAFSLNFSYFFLTETSITLKTWFSLSATFIIPLLFFYWGVIFIVEKLWCSFRVVRWNFCKTTWADTIKK